MDTEDRFRIVAAAALTDGQFHDAERLVLQRLAVEWKIPFQRAQELVRHVGTGGDVPVNPPRDLDERRRLFYDVIDVIIADEKLKVAEFALLHSVADAFGVPRKGVNRALKLRLAARGARAAREEAAEPLDEVEEASESEH